MNSRNKKSKNAGYKNVRRAAAKNHQTEATKKSETEAAGGDSQGEGKNDLISMLEKSVVTNQRKNIASGKEKKLINAYGEAGLEDYLVGSVFAESFEMGKKEKKLKSEQSIQMGQLANKYFKRSSEKEHPLGQFARALALLQGQYGVDQDEEAGIEIMLKAAKKGCGPASYNHGLWLLEGAHGFEKNPKKAHKYFTKAKKDPILPDFKEQHFGTLHCLGRMRLAGEGSVKSPSVALKYFREADQVMPGRLPTGMLKEMECLAAISGVELQREADNRYRRLKHVLRGVQYQPLSDWVGLWSYYGMALTKQPTVEEGKVSMTHDDFVAWMSRAGVSQTLIDEYPAMGEPLPPLECERPGCDATEETLGEVMKKCTECQGPYCSVACQRADWVRHRPVCEAIAGSMNSELTEHDVETLRGAGPDLVQQLQGMGLDVGDIQEDRQCSHGDSKIPCGIQCFKERGAPSMLQHHYTMVTQKLTGKQREAARAAGFDLPDLEDKVEPVVPDAEENIAAEVAGGGGGEGGNQSSALKRQLKKLESEEHEDNDYVLFTPRNEDYDMGISLADFQAKIFFKVMWNRCIKVPWGSPALKSKAFWFLYELLQGSLPSERYRKMLRTQLQAEFGVDPFLGKPSNNTVE